MLTVVLISCQASSSTISKSAPDSNKNKTIIKTVASSYSETTLDSLQGAWISNEDNDYIRIIESNHCYDVYKNEPDTLKAKILFTDTCTSDIPNYDDISSLDGKRQIGKFMIVSDLSDSSNNLCYQIEYIDNARLLLIYRGKELSFKKK